MHLTSAILSLFIRFIYLLPQHASHRHPELRLRVSPSTLIFIILQSSSSVSSGTFHQSVLLVCSSFFPDAILHGTRTPDWPKPCRYAHNQPSKLLFSPTHSTTWSIWWKSCSSCNELSRDNPQSKSDISSTHTKKRGLPSCRFLLWSWWSYALAPALDPDVLSLRCHAKQAWRSQWSPCTHVVGPNLRWFQDFWHRHCWWIRGAERSKFLLLQALMTSLESRINDFQKTTPNLFLSSMAKAMQDACQRLGSLKTTYSQMRFGLAEFQCYYLEVLGFLDYMEIYKPHMDGKKPPAETVANCIGAFTFNAHTVQDFHMAGLPVWFLRPKTIWDSSVNCNTLKIVTAINPSNTLCIVEHDLPFPWIFRGTANDPDRHGAIHVFSWNWLVFKDPFAEPSKGQ